MRYENSSDLAASVLPKSVLKVLNLKLRHGYATPQLHVRALSGARVWHSLVHTLYSVDVRSAQLKREGRRLASLG